MLKVPCGVSGRVRIVKENSITGEITHDSEFENIWTDYGLSTISTYCSVVASWPNRLHWGSGAHSLPHNGVTSLASHVGYGTVSFMGNDGITYDATTCSVTRTRSATQPARGVTWSLSELGLSDGTPNSNMRTYALVKNMAGIPTPITVSDVEIVTIYYTIQIQYPMTLPPQSIDVVGLPPTTATFKLHPERPNFTSQYVGGRASAPAGSALSGYTSAAFASGVHNSSVDGNKNVWNIDTMNRTTGFFGGSGFAAHHMWQLSPPITKDNTQVLELEIFWQFTNATPIEVP